MTSVMYLTLVFRIITLMTAVMYVTVQLMPRLRRSIMLNLTK